MSGPVVVTPYDPAWPRVFESLRDRVLAGLGDPSIAVEHVGSTSVPGLAAKPVIDMDVVLSSVSDLTMAIRRLASIGYLHQGDLGIPGREAFAQPPGLPEHHLYVCAEGSDELYRHIVFRDYLRTHPDAARDYGKVKTGAAQRFPFDRNAYMDAKRDTVEMILQRALNWAKA